MSDKPDIWTVWRHRRGQLYRVVGFSNMAGNDSDNYPFTVIYEGVSSGDKWSRPLNKWHESMTLTGED